VGETGEVATFVSFQMQFRREQLVNGNPVEFYTESGMSFSEAIIVGMRVGSVMNGKLENLVEDRERFP
jgi:hypothetical protein